MRKTLIFRSLVHVWTVLSDIPKAAANSATVRSFVWGNDLIFMWIEASSQAVHFYQHSRLAMRFCLDPLIETERIKQTASECAIFP